MVGSGAPPAVLGVGAGAGLVEVVDVPGEEKEATDSGAKTALLAGKGLKENEGMFRPDGLVSSDGEGDEHREDGTDESQEDADRASSSSEEGEGGEEGRSSVPGGEKSGCPSSSKSRNHGDVGLSQKGKEGEETHSV